MYKGINLRVNLVAQFNHKSGLPLLAINYSLHLMQSTPLYFRKLSFCLFFDKYYPIPCFYNDLYLAFPGKYLSITSLFLVIF